MDSHFSEKNNEMEHSGAIFALKKRIADLEAAEKERDSAIESLKLSEIMFSRILTFSPDSIIISSLEDGRYINVNDSFLDAVGYKRADLVGKTSLNLNIWDSPEERDLFVKKLLADGYIQNFEAKFRKKDGYTGTVLMSSEIVDINGESCMITLSKDITDRKKAETSLRESEQRLRTIFETSPDAIIITDFETGAIIEFNQGFIELSGYSREEIVAERKMLREKLVEHHFFVDFRERLCKDCFVRNMTFQFSRNDGVLKTALVSARMVTLNNIKCILSIIKDIDDLKKIRIELEKRQAELTESKVMIQKLSTQTEQFSLAAASMITMKDEEQFLSKISRAISEYSDFNRVVISYFKDSFPYRDIIGYRGFSEDEIKSLAAYEARREWFACVFDEGVKIGKFSCYVNAGKQQLKYPGLMMPGKSGFHFGSDGMGSEDCLFVRLSDQRGNLAGIICVDGSKSGLKPTAEMVRPLEIFSSLIAQIIISRKAHEERIKSEIKYRTILEKIDDPYFEIDLEGNYTFYNSALNSTLGYSDVELLNSNIKKHFLPFMSESVFDEILAMISNKSSSRTLQYEIVTKKGMEIAVETHFSIIENSDGTPVGFRGISRDITIHKRVEEELKKARDTAEATGRAQRSFLANISHEIRTPLSGVIGMCRLMMDTCLTGEQYEYINSLNESADFLMNVINDVLDFSKLQAGQFTLENADFSVADVVSRAVTIMKNEAVQKGLDTVITISPLVPEYLYGDNGRIGQILVNMVGNAIKFTEKGSIGIIIDVAEEFDDRIILKFQVKDTGIGIPFEQMGKLFRPFSQIDASLSRNYRGTGLGLAISRQLAELMGGAIGVKSRPGNGSLFWFTVCLGKISSSALNIADDTRLEAMHSESSAIPFSARIAPRILIVEDNLINQLLIMKYMEKLGFQGKSAKNGREALDILKAENYDLVLMDLQMPEMSGIDATLAIRNPESGVMMTDIPIIAVTAHAMKEDRERCLEAGMNDYISKPVTLQGISEIINRYIPVSQSF